MTAIPNESPQQRLGRLVEQYQTDLLRMCYIQLHDTALAEDAVQETFIKAYKAMPAFRGDCSEKTWLMRIAVNTCRDLLHSAWFRHLDRRITPEHLPEPLILLYYYEAMTTEEIAQTLGVAKSTVSTRLEQGRQKLRQALERRRSHG